MARGSSGLIKLMLFVAGCGIVASIIMPMLSKQRSSSADDAASAGATRSYSLDPARNTWPPLLENAGTAASSAVALGNYYVVLDGSGSMRSSECSGDLSKIEAAIAALAHFVGSVPQDANLGLTVFDDAGISERVPLGTGNRAAFRQALAQVGASGGTPLRSAIELGYSKLLEQGRQQIGYGDYHLVVVTDGYPEPESEDPTAIVQELLAETPVILHTIGFCIGTEHVLNQPGRSYYVAADSPQQLAEGLRGVLAEAPSFDVTTFGQ